MLASVSRDDLRLDATHLPAFKTGLVLMGPALVNGTTKDTGATPNVDVPSVLLTPVWVTAKNMGSTVVADKFVDKAALCAGAFATMCTSAGIS